jgi:hypothetical protein
VDLVSLRNEHVASSAHNLELRTRLLSLREKMQAVGDELYTTRLKQAGDAVDLLD